MYTLDWAYSPCNFMISIGGNVYFWGSLIYAVIPSKMLHCIYPHLHDPENDHWAPKRHVWEERSSRRQGTLLTPRARIQDINIADWSSLTYHMVRPHWWWDLMRYVAVAEYCMVGSRIRCNIERVMKGWCCGSSWNSEQYDAREAHKGRRMIVRVIRVTVYATWLPSRGMYNQPKCIVRQILQFRPGHRSNPGDYRSFFAFAQ